MIDKIIDFKTQVALDQKEEEYLKLLQTILEEWNSPEDENLF
jgi:hypothetical protein